MDSPAKLPKNQSLKDEESSMNNNNNNNSKIVDENKTSIFPFSIKKSNNFEDSTINKAEIKHTQSHIDNKNDDLISESKNIDKIDIPINESQYNENSSLNEESSLSLKTNESAIISNEPNVNKYSDDISGTVLTSIDLQSEERYQDELEDDDASFSRQFRTAQRLKFTKTRTWACDRCYLLKIKCDSQKPSCASCLRHKQECSYEGKARRDAARNRRKKRSRIESATTVSQHIPNVNMISGNVGNNNLSNIPTTRYPDDSPPYMYFQQQSEGYGPDRSYTGGYGPQKPWVNEDFRRNEHTYPEYSPYYYSNYHRSPWMADGRRQQYPGPPYSHHPHVHPHPGPSGPGVLPGHPRPGSMIPPSSKHSTIHGPYNQINGSRNANTDEQASDHPTDTRLLNEESNNEGSNWKRSSNLNSNNNSTNNNNNDATDDTNTNNTNTNSNINNVVNNQKYKASSDRNLNSNVSPGLKNESFERHSSRNTSNSSNNTESINPSTEDIPPTSPSYMDNSRYPSWHNKANNNYDDHYSSMRDNPSKVHHEVHDPHDNSSSITPSGNWSSRQGPSLGPPSQSTGNGAGRHPPPPPPPPAPLTASNNGNTVGNGGRFRDQRPWNGYDGYDHYEKYDKYDKYEQYDGYEPYSNRMNGPPVSIPPPGSSSSAALYWDRQSEISNSRRIQFDHISSEYSHTEYPPSDYPPYYNRNSIKRYPPGRQPPPPPSSHLGY